MELLKALQWRYATKKFDSSKSVSTGELEKLKSAIQLSASSYGLQLYKVLVIENPEIKEQLRAVSWDQSQITDASHLFVFCNYTKVSPEAIKSFIRQTAETRNVDVDQLSRYGDFILEKLNEKTAEEMSSWLKSQTYLALGNLLNACAELKIDACPMEGFQPEAYNKILGLNKKGLNAVVIAPVGYRHEKDETIGQVKVRKPMEKLFETI